MKKFFGICAIFMIFCTGAFAFSSLTTSFTNAYNAIQAGGTPTSAEVKTFATVVRDRFTAVDAGITAVENRLNAVEAKNAQQDSRIAALENPPPPPPPPPPTPQCSDGINNDPAEDAFIDFPNDPGCTDAQDNTELGNPPPPPPPGEPAPIAGQGYTVRFNEPFDVFSGGSWGEGIWYDPGAPANSIFVQNGVLNLVSRRSQGYQNITVTTEGGDNPATFQYGYLEARLRWTSGNGAWPGWWMLSYRHAVNPSFPSINPVCAQTGRPAAECYSGEIDAFEGQGSQPSTFYNTIHKNSCSCYGVADEQNSNNAESGINMTGFHTYAVLWTANSMKWYLDDQLLHTENASDSALNGRIFAALRQPMFLLLQMWIGGWTVGPDASTPDELKTEVDWVKVWQQ